MGEGNVMNRITNKAGFVVYLLVALLFCTADSNAQNWQQAWADDFNETTIDNSIWNFDSGPANGNIPRGVFILPT